MIPKTLTFHVISKSSPELHSKFRPYTYQSVVFQQILTRAEYFLWLANGLLWLVNELVFIFGNSSVNSWGSVQTTGKIGKSRRSTLLPAPYAAPVSHDRPWQSRCDARTTTSWPITPLEGSEEMSNTSSTLVHRCHFASYVMSHSSIMSRSCGNGNMRRVVIHVYVSSVSGEVYT